MATNNLKVIEDSKLLAIKIADKHITDMLISTAIDLLKKTKVPFVTHNLWDSIGCGVYKNGTLMNAFYPDKKARVPRNKIYDVSAENRDYWGIDELMDEITHPAMITMPDSGWVLYYVAAMPYSEAINNRTDVEVLREDLIRPILESHIMKLDL